MHRPDRVRDCSGLCQLFFPFLFCTFLFLCTHSLSRPKSVKLKVHDYLRRRRYSLLPLSPESRELTHAGFCLIEKNQIKQHAPPDRIMFAMSSRKIFTFFQIYTKMLI